MAKIKDVIRFIRQVGEDSAKSDSEELSLLFDIEFDTTWDTVGTGSPSKHDPFEEDEVNVLAVDGIVEFHVTELYYLTNCTTEHDHMTRTATNTNEQKNRFMGADCLLKAMYMTDVNFRELVDQMVDARLDKLMQDAKIRAGEFEPDYDTMRGGHDDY